LQSLCPSYNVGTGTKRKRGHANPRKGWNSGKQVFQLQFNEYMQVVSKNQPNFASQLGLLVKDGTKLPLVYTSWRKKGMNSYKETVWEEIKVRRIKLVKVP
jgi:hypothetical protein